MSVIYEFSLPVLNMWRPQEERRAKILMIPGFWTGDHSLYPLAWWLRGDGHRVFFAGIWWNAGCPRDTIERLHRAVESLYLTDRQKLVIIGHSLGGIHARELARRAPDMVERAVLMGSAIRHPLSATNPLVLAFYVISRRNHSDGTGCMDSLGTLCGTHHLEPPEVPETIIYSRRDEVVAWTSCLEEGDNVEAIEVDSSHYTMPYRPEVWRLISARLKGEQQEDFPRAPLPIRANARGGLRHG